MIKKLLLILIWVSGTFCSTNDIDLEDQTTRTIIGYKNRSIDIQTEDKDAPDKIHKFYKTENLLYCAGGFALGMTCTSIFLTTVWYNHWLEFDL